MLPKRTTLCVLFLAAVCALHQPAAAQLDPTVARPPVAEKVPRQETLHGETWVDNYYWLREKANPKVSAYLEQEFLEWGNPRNKVEYDYLKSYCPYTNLAARDYPAMLVQTSLNDSQVMYWEPAKYVAKLRATKTDKNPLLLKTNMAAGHGGASGRYDALREQAFTQAFVLSQLGITK